MVNKVAKSRKQIKKFISLERGVDTDKLKTARMFLLEREWQTDICELLDGRQNGLMLAHRYGVTEACISKWRKRLGIQPIHQICPECGRTMPLAQKICGRCGGELAKIRSEPNAR